MQNYLSAMKIKLNQILDPNTAKQQHREEPLCLPKSLNFLKVERAIFFLVFFFLECKPISDHQKNERWVCLYSREGHTIKGENKLTRSYLGQKYV
uniref:Uncharacterized protein n=1 Tax=Solanum tuberosum TaxID=4113 RepID=M0ZQQ8_SOLTU